LTLKNNDTIRWINFVEYHRANFYDKGEGVIMKKSYMIIPAILLVLLCIILLSSCTRTVTLYFASMEDNEFYLVPQTREVQSSGNIYQLAIQELIKGPAGEALYPTLPSDTTVNSIEVSGGVAVVDFDIRIITNFEEIPHSSTTETLALYSITNTLTEFDDIEKVKITIEGKETGQVDSYYVEDFWGHIGIYEVFERNEEIIKYE
jgi:germination protein M